MKLKHKINDLLIKYAAAIVINCIIFSGDVQRFLEVRPSSSRFQRHALIIIFYFSSAISLDTLLHNGKTLETAYIKWYFLCFNRQLNK